MKVVLDTSAIIYLNDFRKFDEILTVQEVVEEVKDKVSSMKLSGLRFKVIEPSKTSIDEIKKIAKETGDLEKLSNTDIKVLALAKEKNCTVISDDRNVQNIAEKLNIKYVSIYNEKITKLIVWKKFCRNCRKKYEKGNVCSVCGAELIRIHETFRKLAGKDL
jgi:endoribonuclease Nob1